MQVSVACTQMRCSWELEANVARAEADAARIAHLMAQYGFAGTRAVTGLTLPVLEHGRVVAVRLEAAATVATTVGARHS